MRCLVAWNKVAELHHSLRLRITFRMKRRAVNETSAVVHLHSFWHVAKEPAKETNKTKKSSQQTNTGE